MVITHAKNELSMLIDNILDSSPMGLSDSELADAIRGNLSVEAMDELAEKSLFNQIAKITKEKRDKDLVSFLDRQGNLFAEDMPAMLRVDAKNIKTRFATRPHVEIAILNREENAEKAVAAAARFKEKMRAAMDIVDEQGGHTLGDAFDLESK